MGTDRGGDDPEAPQPEGMLTRWRRNRTTRILLRVVLTTLGGGLVLGGLALVPLPGPGWAIVVAGLAVLALEYPWARHLLVFTKDKLAAWLHWVGRQSLLVRGIITVAGIAFVGVVAWWSLRAAFGFDYVCWGLAAIGVW